MLLRKVLRRSLVRVLLGTRALRRVLRKRGGVHRRHLKHAVSQSTAPSACTLLSGSQKKTVFLATLVSHYSAIGDTISCDGPYSAIGFRGKFFLRCPSYKACLWRAIGHLYGKKWECSSDSLRYHREHSATGVLLHLSRDRGGGVFRSGH